MTMSQKRAARLVLFGLLAGWLIKSNHLLPMFWANVDYPLEHAMFPAVFRNGWVSLIGYLLPIVTLPLLLLKISRRRVLFAAAVMLACSWVMLLHINSHNDATFNVCLWVAAWLLWFGWQSQREDAEAFFEAGGGLDSGVAHLMTDDSSVCSVRAVFIGHAIISLIFLGGFVGKLTGEYWSGEALFHLYFDQRQTFFFNRARELYDMETMRSMATGLSRVAIGCEAFLACALFLPTKLLVWVGVPIVVAMVGLTGYMLFSVLGPLIFLMLALGVLQRERSRQSVSS